MATSATPGMNPAYLLDPSLYGDQQAIAQQQKLADLLMTEGITPMQGTQMAGNVALRNSPTQSMAKIAALLSGQSIQRQSNQASQDLMQRQSQAVMPLYFGQQGQQGQQPQGQGAPTNPMQAPASSPQYSQGGVMTIPGMDPRAAFLSSMQNPDEYSKAFIASQAPNDTTKAALQGGYDPQFANRMAFIKSNTDPKIFGMRQAGMGDTDIYNAIFGAAAKDAEISRRPTEAFSNPVTGEAGMVGKIPEGANIVGRPGPNGAVSVTPMPGNARVLAGNSASTTAGTNSQTPTIQYDGNGNPVQSTKAQDVRRANMIPPAQQAAADAESLKILDLERSRTSDPQEIATLDRMRARLGAGPTVSPEQRPGVVTAKDSTAKDVVGRNQAVIADANSVKQDVENLTRMGELANSSNFGPGASTSAKWQALASQFPGMGLIVNPASLQQQQTNVTLMKKYMSDMAGRMSGASGTGTDARLQNAIDSLPNDAAPDAAIKTVVPMLIARRTARLDEGNIRQALGADTQAISSFETKWRTAYNPIAYEATLATKGMSPQQTVQYVHSHYTPAQAAEIMKSRQALTALGAQFGQ